MKILLLLLAVWFFNACTLAANVLPLYLVELGGTDEDYALVVDKKSQVLSLYKGSHNGPHLIKNYRCTTGKNNHGHKHRAGDLKTPNGIYLFRGIKDDDRLPAKYGVRAFIMDYPNDFDRLRNKTGYGIWLHAVDDDSRVNISYDTEGCVVVTNDDILELSEFISLNSTPIIIDDSILTTPAEELDADKEKLHAQVKGWADAWQSKDIDRYIDYYDDHFRLRGMNKTQYRKYKNRLNKTYHKIEVGISNIRILRHHDYMIISFLQEYRSSYNNSKGLHSKGRKRLFLVRNGDDDWKIISERFRRTY